MNHTGAGMVFLLDKFRCSPAGVIFVACKSKKGNFVFLNELKDLSLHK
jgi:hypothetical protein